MRMYDEMLLPHLINCACGMKTIERQRKKIVPLACGDVLEIGMGSGLNLKHYNRNQVNHLWGLEPSEGMRKKAQENIAVSNMSVEWLPVLSEKIPLRSETVDTVVLTYTLCTIAQPHTALSEMRRILKPKGKLLFSEHGLAPEPSVQKWQRRLNPIWSKLAGGCQLDRHILNLIESSGFSIEDSHQAYVKGPKVATYQYWGSAVPNELDN